MKTLFCCVFALLCFISCQTVAVRADDLTFGQPFVIRPETTVSISNEFDITLDKITDSRCPQGVQCVRAGDLFATFTYKSQQKVVEKIDLCISGECLQYNNTEVPRTFLYSGEPVEVNNQAYSIVVNDYEPKNATQQLQQKDYSLDITVSRK